MIIIIIMIIKIITIQLNKCRNMVNFYILFWFYVWKIHFFIGYDSLDFFLITQSHVIEGTCVATEIGFEGIIYIYIYMRDRQTDKESERERKIDSKISR